MTQEEQSPGVFEDDSSGALGLGHGASYGGYAWNERQNSIIRKQMLDEGKTPPEPGPGSNSAAYEDLEAKMASLRRENPEWPELKVLLEARMALAGPQTGDVDLDAMVTRADPLGASPRSLMSKKVDLKGRGGSRSRRKNKPKPKFYCDECHTEYCPHRPVKVKRGRPTKEASVRSIKRSIRMTGQTVATFLGYRIGPSDALALMGVALREHRSIDAVIVEYLKTVDKKP